MPRTCSGAFCCVRVHLPGGLLIRLIRPVWLLIARLSAHRRALHGLTAHRIAPRRIRIVLRRIMIARLPAHADLRLIPCVPRLPVQLLIIARIVPLACAYRLPLRSELCTLEALARAVLRIVVLRVRALHVLRVREALAHAVLRIIVGILAIHGVSAALRILPLFWKRCPCPYGTLPVCCGGCTGCCRCVPLCLSCLPSARLSRSWKGRCFAVC